ncbi:FeoC-like transcriptional regulator [Methylohalobius crimeensis]|uniref:FeoC-like transcriptional regulator n=1 Tax=Methylohalobius crimeensis TaxID=244365 RepID=UPI0013764FD7
MLEKLLRIVVTRGTISSAELSRRLGVSPALAENMLHELTGRGYLKVVAGRCSVSCDRCLMYAMCQGDQRPRIWVLSRKGEQWLSSVDMRRGSALSGFR